MGEGPIRSRVRRMVRASSLCGCGCETCDSARYCSEVRCADYGLCRRACVVRALNTRLYFLDSNAKALVRITHEHVLMEGFDMPGKQSWDAVRWTVHTDGGKS